MGNLSEVTKDPTLQAVDFALTQAEKKEVRRDYLGFSQVGEQCERRLWYDFNGYSRAGIPVSGLRAINDGHMGEDLMAKRLQMVDGIELHVENPDGSQFGFSDLQGKFRGHMDGAIRGVVQSPQTWHVWEHKQVNEKKFRELVKLRGDGEKTALERWDYTYYCQAVLYMYYSGMERHYLTCATPGGRDYTGVRTNKNTKLAEALRGKASRLIAADRAPERAYSTPAFYKCKWCPYNGECWADG